MQYKKQTLYKAISKEFPEMSEDFIKDYLLYILDGIKDWSRDPDNLILVVKGLGRFYWKKKNLYRDYTQRIQYTDPVFKNAEEHQKFVDNTEFILKRYEDFEKKRDDIRKENFGDDFKPHEQVRAEYKEFLKNKQKQ